MMYSVEIDAGQANKILSCVRLEISNVLDDLIEDDNAILESKLSTLRSIDYKLTEALSETLA